MATYRKSICHDNWGWYAEVYTDDDASGHGDNARVGHWYGTREQCEAVEPATVLLAPLDLSPTVDAFDIACERRYD